MGSGDTGTYLSNLPNVKTISLSWPCAGSAFQVDDSCQTLISYIATPSAFSCLTSLSLYSFFGYFPPLVEALADLPCLRRLDFFHLNVNQYMTVPHLRLIDQHLPHLEHLGANGIDPTDPNQDVLPAIKSIEIGISVSGPGRIRDVFPSLESISLRWSWSALTRKIAGLRFLTSLSISCPDYLEDLGLLRTLPLLKRLKISKGFGFTIISSVLESLVDSRLEEFALVEWALGHSDHDIDLHKTIRSLCHLQTLSLSDVHHDIAELMLAAAIGMESLIRVKLSWDLFGLVQNVPSGPGLQVSFHSASLFSSWGSLGKGSFD